MSEATFTPIPLPPRIPTGQRRLFRVPKPGAGSFLTLEEHGDGEHERKATWSELYLDISYVAVFSKLVKRKNAINYEETFNFMMVFVPVWWCWMNFTIYLSRFDTDDLFNRILHLVQMLASVAFAVSVEDAIKDSESKSLFVLAFCIIRVTLVVGYVVNFLVLPKARRFCFLHGAFNVASVVLWATSLLLAYPYFLVNWWLSFLSDLILFFITSKEAKRHIPFSQSHLPERFGLLTIIMLGENILNLIYAFNNLSPFENSNLWILVLISILNSYLMWWIYFDDFKWEIVSKANRVFKIWIFIHLPLHMFYLFFSVCVVDIVRRVPDSPLNEEKIRFLSAGGMIFILNAGMKLLNSWSVKEHYDKYNMTIYLSRFANGIIIFLMILIPGFETLSLLLTMMGFCLFQVVVDIVVTEMQYRRDLKQSQLSDTYELVRPTSETEFPASNITRHASDHPLPKRRSPKKRGDSKGDHHHE